MHKKDEIPVLHRDIIALLKFDDIGPVPACGCACRTIDEHKMLYFAPHLSRNGYAWDLVVHWDYLGEVTQGYTVPCPVPEHEPDKDPEICVNCAHFDITCTEAGWCDEKHNVMPNTVHCESFAPRSAKQNRKGTTK